MELGIKNFNAFLGKKKKGTNETDEGHCKLKLIKFLLVLGFKHFFLFICTFFPVSLKYTEL